MSCASAPAPPPPRSKCNNLPLPPRNLGATAATFEGHGEGLATTPGGLYYHFGRSTPFAGTLGSPMANVITEAQNFAWVVKNPLVYIATNSNWSTQDNSTSYMWNDKNVGRYDDGKSIFDPSPIGWRLPIHGTFHDFEANATTVSSNVATYTPASANFHAVGVRHATTSSFNYIGGDSHIYTSTPSSTSNGYRICIDTSKIYINTNARTRGNSIRPVRE